MFINSISIAGPKAGNYHNCSVEICKNESEAAKPDSDKVKIPASLVAISYEEDLANPEIWIETASLKHSLKIILNQSIASRGQAWINENPPESIKMTGDVEERFNLLLEPLFADDNHKKYFTVDNIPKLFRDTLGQASPINVSNLYL